MGGENALSILLEIVLFAIGIWLFLDYLELRFLRIPNLEDKVKLLEEKLKQLEKQ